MLNRARPVYVQRDDRIKAHFLICFLAPLTYQLLEKQFGNTENTYVNELCCS